MFIRFSRLLAACVVFSLLSSVTVASPIGIQKAKKGVKKQAVAPAKKGPALLAALPKGLAELEKVLGPSRPYDDRNPTQRKFTVRGYSEAYAEVSKGQIEFLVLRLEDGTASWKEYFINLGLPTDVKWEGDDTFISAAKFKGLPEGWKVTAMLNMDTGSKTILNIQRIQ